MKTGVMKTDVKNVFENKIHQLQTTKSKQKFEMTFYFRIVI